MAQFEVLSLDADRELICQVARRLAKNGPQARKLRASVSRLSVEPVKRGSDRADQRLRGGDGKREPL